MGSRDELDVDFPPLPRKYAKELWAQWSKRSLRRGLIAEGLCDESLSERQRGPIYELCNRSFGPPTSDLGRGFVARSNLYPNSKYTGERLELGDRVPSPPLPVQQTEKRTDRAREPAFSSDSEEDERPQRQEERGAGASVEVASDQSSSTSCGVNPQQAAALFQSALQAMFTRQVPLQPGAPTEPAPSKKVFNRDSLPECDLTNVPAWLERFERTLSFHPHLRDEDYVWYLSLMGKGLVSDVLFQMARPFSYQEVKERILRESGHTRDHYRVLYEEAEKSEGESYDAFASRLRSYLYHWIDAPRTVHEKEMTERLLIPRFLKAFPKDQRAILRAAEPASVEEVSRKASAMKESGAAKWPNPKEGYPQAGGQGGSGSQPGGKSKKKNGWRQMPYKKGGNKKGRKGGGQPPTGGSGNPQKKEGAGGQGKGPKPANGPGGRRTVTCYGCGKEGHYQRECPTNPPQSKSMGLLLPLPRTNEKEQSRFMGVCLLNGKPATCRVDTQAGVTFVKNSKAVGKCAHRGEVTVRAFGANPATYPRRRITVALDSVCTTVDAGVFPPSYLDVDVLLGQDVLEGALQFLQVKDCQTLQWTSRPTSESLGQQSHDASRTDEPGPFGGSSKGSKRRAGETWPQSKPTKTGKPKGERTGAAEVLLGTEVAVAPVEADASRSHPLGVTTRAGTTTQTEVGGGNPSACETAEQPGSVKEREELAFPPPAQIREEQRACPSLEKVLELADRGQIVGNNRFTLSTDGVAVRQFDPDYPRSGVSFGQGVRFVEQLVLPRSLI